MRPDDCRARIMRQQPLEGGNIFTELRRVGRRFLFRRQRHRARNGFHVQIDGNAVLCSNIRQQQKQWVVRRSILIGRGPIRNVPPTILQTLRPLRAEAPRREPSNFVNLRAGISGSNRLLNHGVQRPAAADDCQFPGILIRLSQNNFRVISPRFIKRLGQYEKKNLHCILHLQSFERRLDGTVDVPFIKVRMRFHIGCYCRNRLDCE